MSRLRDELARLTDGWVVVVADNELYRPMRTALDALGKTQVPVLVRTAECPPGRILMIDKRAVDTAR